MRNDQNNKYAYCSQMLLLLHFREFKSRIFKILTFPYIFGFSKRDFSVGLYSYNVAISLKYTSIQEF
jgi:hypothetical protein